MAHKPARFVSAIPGWSYVTILAGVIVFAIVVAATRKRVSAPAWPFCARCRSQHAKTLFIGFPLLAVGFVLALAAPSMSDDLSGPAFLVAFGAIIAGTVLLTRSAWAFIAGGRVVDKAQAVEFRRANEAFAAQAVAAQQAAAQHYAAQQAAAQHYAAQQAAAQHYAAQQAAAAHHGPQQAAQLPAPQASTEPPPTQPFPVSSGNAQPTDVLSTPAAPTDVLSTPQRPDQP
nr:hypothetical protein [uncultured Actinoplanes sp.]